MTVMASRLYAEQEGWDTLSRQAQTSQPWWETSPEAVPSQQATMPSRWVPKREAHPWSSLYYAQPDQGTFWKESPNTAENPSAVCKPLKWQQASPCQER